MRKLKIALTLLFAMSFSLFLFACGGAKGVAAVKVSGQKTTFTEADDFSVGDLVVQVQYKGDKEYTEYKADGKFTNDTENKILKYDQFEVDYSQFNKGYAGEFKITVTPNPAAQREADPSVTELVSVDYNITVEHAFGEPVNGIETCSVCGGEREIKTTNETVTTVAWGQPATLTAGEGVTPIGVAPREGENHVSYGTVGIGQSARISMNITAVDKGATWNTPLMGIRSTNKGLIPREDAYVIGTAAGFSTPDGGTKDAASTAGTATATSTPWIVYSDGTTWNSTDIEGKEMEIFYNYNAENGIMEIRHTLDPNGSPKVLTYTIKVPAASYEIVCYGEKVTMNITKIEYVRNLLLENFTVDSLPTKTVYAEHNMFRIDGIATTAYYTRNTVTPIDSYNVFAKLDVPKLDQDNNVVKDNKGEVVMETTEIDIRTEKLVYGMYDFYIEFSGRKFDLKKDLNCEIKITESEIDAARGDFTVVEKDVVFAGGDTEYAYDVDASGVLTLTATGVATKLSPEQQTALGTAKTHYVLVRLLGVEANRFAGATLDGAKIYFDKADNAVALLVPVDKNDAAVKTVTLTPAEGVTLGNGAKTVKIDFTALDFAKLDTQVGSYLATGSATIGNGGTFTVVYNNVPAEKGEMYLGIGTVSRKYSDIKTAAPTANNPYTFINGVSSIIGLTENGTTTTVTYKIEAADVSNDFATSFELSLIDKGVTVTKQTVYYTFEMGNVTAEDGYVKVNDNTYIKINGTNLLVVSLYQSNKLASSALNSNVSINIQNDLGAYYDLSVNTAKGVVSFANTNTVTLNSAIKTVVAGSIDNGDDYDHGMAIVSQIDLSKLGIRATTATTMATYYFEVQGANDGNNYTLYKSEYVKVPFLDANGDPYEDAEGNPVMIDEEALKVVPVTATGDRKVLKAAQCLEDGYSVYEYKNGTDSFYYGLEFTPMTGAHDWKQVTGSTTEWVCDLCHATRLEIKDGDTTYYAVALPAINPVANMDFNDAWWNNGDGGSASGITNMPAGEFVLAYQWKNTRDKNWYQDVVIELTDGTNYFDMNMMRGGGFWGNPALWEASANDANPKTNVLTTTVTKNGAAVPEAELEAIDGQATDFLVQGDATVDKWGGDYQVIIRRIGTTLTIVQTITNTAGDVYEVVNTFTGFTTAALTVQLVGNVYWVDDIYKSVGTVSRVDNTGFEVGTTDNALGYTATTPVWKSQIACGQKVIVSGKHTAGTNNWNGALAYLYEGDDDTKALINFRPDNWINNAGPAQENDDARQARCSEYGWVFVKNLVGFSIAPTGDFWAAANQLKSDCDVTITWDWSDESKIVITYVYTHATLGTFTQIYEVSAAAGKTLASSYKIGIGGDGSYLNATSVIVES